MEIKRVFEQFCTGTKFVNAVTYGNGHINDTYLIAAENGGTPENYILQRVNSSVFKNPEQVINNISAVTEHISHKLEKTQKDISRLVLRLSKSNDGKPYYRDENGNYYRVYNYIPDAICLDLPETETDFYNSAVAFGEFQCLLSDFPVERIYETIPDFHNTEKRYRNLVSSALADRAHRASNVAEELEFFRKRQSFYGLLEQKHKEGILPKKITHNDTKMNNVMLDRQTRKPLCVIDLDTVMPGFSVNDFGDSIRFGASTAAEDERKITMVHFDKSMYDIYLNGFLRGCGSGLTENEKKLLPVGAVMMTLECGMRFLTDYLDGDTYFKTAYKEHNLVRCHTQMKLAYEMEEKLL